MSKILLLLVVLFLISCSSGISYNNKVSINKIGMEPLPRWVYELPPEGDYVIGISARSFDNDSMLDAARQMAAVMKSRNKGSYAIAKSTLSSGSDIIKDARVGFLLNVSEPDETLRIYDSLTLIDETYLYDHYIALFSQTNKVIADSYCQKQILNFPQWYSKDEIKIVDDHILSYAQEGSYNLVTAWEKTAEKARYEIAKYLEKDVQGKIESTNEIFEKNIAIESTRKLIDIEITRSFIIMKNYDSLISYQVFLELKMKK